MAGSFALCVSLLSFVPALAESRSITKVELQSHNSAASCWIAIDGSVYDITGYLSEHTSVHQYSLLPWCGKDATKGWNDKDGKNKSHSRKASIQLNRYRIGALVP